MSAVAKSQEGRKIGPEENKSLGWGGRCGCVCAEGPGVCDTSVLLSSHEGGSSL